MSSMNDRIGRVRTPLRPRLTFRGGLWACRIDAVRQSKLYMHTDPRIAYWLWFIARAEYTRWTILADLGIPVGELRRLLCPQHSTP